MHPLLDPRSLLPSVAWRSSIKLTPSPSKSGDRAEGARRGLGGEVLDRGASERAGDSRGERRLVSAARNPRPAGSLRSVSTGTGKCSAFAL